MNRTCCAKKKGLEVCAQCDDFPCSRFDTWLDSCAEHDSFVTHAKVKTNLEYVTAHGIEEFIAQQTRRIRLLERMLKGFNEGRSRSFYCLAATLLPVPQIQDALEEAERLMETDGTGKEEVKRRAGVLRECLSLRASDSGIELKLRKR